MIYPYYIITFQKLVNIKKSDVDSQLLYFVYLLYIHNKYIIFFKSVGIHTTFITVQQMLRS